MRKTCSLPTEGKWENIQTKFTQTPSSLRFLNDQNGFQLTKRWDSILIFSEVATFSLSCFGSENSAKSTAKKAIPKQDTGAYYALRKV